MIQLLRVTACAAMLLAATTSARATTLTYAGGGGAIPDQGTFTSDIVVAEGLPILDVTVTLLGLTHTWAGDLISTVTHLDSGTSVTLFHRIGRVGGVPFGGDPSDFGGDYAFNDAFTGDLWAEAAALTGTQVIPSGDYFATGVDKTISLLSLFNGTEAAGTWRLTISDNAGGDIGSLGSWQLDLAVIPEPSSIAMVGLASVAGLGLGLRRRRLAQAR